MKRSALLFTAVTLLLGTKSASAGPLPGAIFTTTATGSRVNANLYAAKEDVYLDGGPGSNAPSSAAALPAGDYYFQVTDPSGSVLLSQDPVAWRRITVSTSGVITSAFNHVIGVDADYASLGARTVRLFPYADTPNQGGVYKVWVTPIGQFVGDASKVDSGAWFHGFVPSWSKTDNFKVKRKASCAATLTIRKFDDANANGVWDKGEQEVAGWAVWVTDPLGVTNLYATPVAIDTWVAGTWTVSEDVASTTPTASFLDGKPTSSCSPGVVTGDFRCGCGDSHAVVFGNYFGCR